MKIGVYTNPYKELKEVTHALKTCLDRFGFSHVDLHRTPSRVIHAETLVPDPVLQDCSAVIAVGGDGTMIEIAKRCAGADIPVLGFNQGKLGFLSESSVEEMEETIARLKSGDYQIEKRHLLRIENGGKVFYGINEIYLGKRVTDRLAEIEIIIDGAHAGAVKGDGLIVSSPTGSTAYSLSCGGPVVSPDIKAMVVVGVCPHSLYSRPIVVGEKSRITIASARPDRTLHMIIDGKPVDDYDFGAIDITIGARACKFIKMSGQNFYKRLTEKMRDWSK